MALFLVTAPLPATALVAPGGGGRAPALPDAILTEQSEWTARPSTETEARLIVLQITDVYTLQHLASFKTLLEETRANARGAKTVCMLTGDFLSPQVC